MRKKREWIVKKARAESMSSSKWNPSDVRQRTYSKTYRGSWANLPDLVLEQIFQYLPYKVSSSDF